MNSRRVYSTLGKVDATVLIKRLESGKITREYFNELAFSALIMNDDAIEKEEYKIAHYLAGFIETIDEFDKSIINTFEECT